MSALLGAGLLTAFVSLLVTGCGEGASDAGGGGQAMALQPAPGSKPVRLRPGVVATVGGGEVTRAELRQVMRVRARGLAAAARGGSESQRRLRHVALVRSSMSQLIQAEDVAQRAEAAGVSVSGREVDAALERMREPFDGPAQWRQFLKRTNQTESEIRDRLRVEMLNRRLYARRPSTGSQKNTADTARMGRERLRARTVCRPGYVVELCSNSPSKPTEAS